jgi:hypothetical protein
MLRMVVWLSRRALTMTRRSPLTNVTNALSDADVGLGQRRCMPEKTEMGVNPTLRQRHLLLMPGDLHFPLELLPNHFR